MANATSDEQNLTTMERAAYIVAGLGLAAAGAKPRPNPLLNVAALLGGSYLAWRGYVGSCPVKGALFGPDGSTPRLG
ncbi:YgaP-like transmembrane domain [Microvirga rosea]|uniref:YgaP-like transmembrane domain n=1 Tax=Microvirga rosea TaxID=2715425 RepID=UPI003872D816